jgi:integrase
MKTATLHPYALPKILARRLALAGIKATGLERLSLHGLRAGFITEAYKGGTSDEAIMEHSRHRDIHTMRGYVRRAKLAGVHSGEKVGHWSCGLSCQRSIMAAGRGSPSSRAHAD